jgi:hypothetical protein
MHNKSESYKQLRQSEVGRDLLEWMDLEYQRTIEKAVTAPQDEAYGLLRSAYGILVVKRHIQSMSAGTKKK